MADRKVKLINVTDINNNKFYNMTQINASQFEAHWGRVGSEGKKKTYSMSEWDSIYRKKTSGKRGKEGTYKDVTELFVEEVVSKDDKVVDIKDSQVRQIVSDLQSYASGSVRQNYIVSASQVTQKQLDEAQNIIDALVGDAKLKKATTPLNDKLLE